MFLGRMALRNTPFSKCHKGLQIDPVTETDPTIPQNERSVKGKWHLGGPSLPLTQTCDRSRGNSGAIRSTACAACPREHMTWLGNYLIPPGLKIHQESTWMSEGKGFWRSLQQASKLGGGCSLSTVPACPAPNIFFPSANYRSVFVIWICMK